MLKNMPSPKLLNKYFKLVIISKDLLNIAKVIYHLFIY